MHDPVAAPAEPVLDPARRLAIERWFVERGVPQLIEGSRSEARLDERAAPLIAGWLVLGTILFWGVNPDRSRLPNWIGVIATLLVVGVGFVALRAVRGRRTNWRSMTFDVVDIGVLALLPAIAAGVIDGSAQETVVAFLNALLGIGFIYVVVLFGLIEVASWGFGRLGSQFAGIVNLLATTLPVLLILVAFLLFAAELWEAAHALRGGELAVVIGLLVAIAALLVATAVRAELARLEAEADWEVVLDDVAGTPAEEPARSVPPAAVERPTLSWWERTNLTALVLISQLLQSTLVALLMLAFLVAFGVVALPADLQERWIGASVTTLLEFDLLGEPRRLSRELITVAAMLSGIVGLYYTGLAITEPARRGDEFRHAIMEVRQILSVRAVYRSALAADARGEARADATVSMPMPEPTRDPSS